VIPSTRRKLLLPPSVIFSPSGVRDPPIGRATTTTFYRSELRVPIYLVLSMFPSRDSLLLVIKFITYDREM